MLRLLSPEVLRCLQNKDDAVIGCAITIYGSLYKVRHNYGAPWHSGLKSLEWVVRTRCTRTRASGLALLRKVVRRVSRSDAGNPKGLAGIFHRSVSPRGLRRARQTTCWGQTFRRSAEDRRRTYQAILTQAEDSW